MVVASPISGTAAPVGTVWAAPPDLPVLGPGDVHVWRVFLDPPFAGNPTVDSIVAEEERKRAFRFFFEEDRFRYLASHFVLRNVLALYLDIPPGRIRFSMGRKGKPEVAFGSGERSLRFNLSRSHDLALIAVARNMEVGVDVERIHPDPGLLTLAERRFTRREVGILRSLPGDLRLEAFFQFWVRKEAVLKAMGEGLSVPLECVDGSCDGIGLARSPGFAGSPEYFIAPVAPQAGYAAALAVTIPTPKLSFWDWSERTAGSAVRAPLRTGTRSCAHRSAAGPLSRPC